MKDQVADHAKDWLTLALTGLGVTYAPHEWIGGMFLALAAAAFAMRMEPEQDKRELWVVLIGAFIVSHAAAMVCHRLLPDVPVQLVMIVAGYLSRRMARFTLVLAGLVEARGNVLTDRILERVLPEKEDK